MDKKKEYYKRYYAKNKEKIQQYYKEHYTKNFDQNKQQRHEYYINNKETIINNNINITMSLRMILELYKIIIIKNITLKIDLDYFNG